MTERSEALIRNVTRGAAVLAPGAGIALLAMELGNEARAPAIAGAAALVAAGPLLWMLARAHLTVLGASAALLLAGALVAIGATRQGSDAGFDLGLGICLAGVAIWTLVAHARERKD